MPINCARCESTGFLNLHQIPEKEMDELESLAAIGLWIERNHDHDVQICDCCGDGEHWYGSPGEHYTNDDPAGDRGPYNYNGGLCECN